MRVTRYAVFAAVLLALTGASVPAATAVAPRGGHDTYVSPRGSDTNPGTRKAPFASIQRALNVAGPGSTVHLAPGRYLQDFVSRSPGVTISGPRSAVVQGTGAGRAIGEIQHDRVRLTGFTIDGLVGDATEKSGYRKKLLYVMSATPGDGVDGLRVDRMSLRNAGEECVRLRYLVTGAEVAHNRIAGCGVWDFRFADGGKVGEGIYLGTAPEQQGLNGAPDDRPDVSRDNWIHHNKIDTQGNECVDIKENSTANLVEHNDCTGQRDPNSAALDARGSGNTFRANRSHDNVGAGVRVGGDTPTDGIHNTIEGNVLLSNAAGGIKFEATPQGRVCGNTLAGNTGGDATGTYGNEYEPSRPC
ncbi:right-handed parallel beta-helix repeat-containing protein [Streptomyces albidoflavus]|uniref:right-handed parallel beta-helix repeat-containing protein n=1 Tax=Streptomyces albidoflavus TaxID=1886 RepID=UPI0033EB2CA8